MKFTWKPIKDLDRLPLGVEVMVCIEGHYCDYIHKPMGHMGGGWEYVYSGSEVQEHKLKAYTHYFIPRPKEKE